MKLNSVKASSLLLLIVFVLLLLSSLIQAPAIQWLNTATGDTSMAKYIYMTAAQTVIFILPSIVYSIIVKKKPSQMRLRGFRPAHIPLIIFLTLTTSTLVIVLNYVAAQIFGQTGETSLSGFTATNTPQIIMAIVSLVVVPAVAEELLLRGIVLSDFESQGTRFAIVMSAVAFSCIHSSFYNFLGPLLAGLVYGYITYKLGSVIPAMLSHMINNLFALLLSMYIKRANIQISPFLFFFVCLIVFLIILMITLKLLEQMLTDRRVKAVYVPPKPFYTALRSLLNICFVVFLFIWIIRSVFEIAG